MGSSPQKTTVQNQLPADALASRAALSKYLVNLIGQAGGGSLPGGYGDIIPIGASRNTFEELLRTGLPADSTGLVNQARGTFENDIAPAIKEQLGAKYGIRFGTPVAESLSRAGRDVTLGLNADLARLGDAAQSRRAGAAQFGLAQGTGGLSQILQMIVSGTGALSATPGSQTTTTSAPGMDWGALLAAAATVAAAAI